MIERTPNIDPLIKMSDVDAKYGSKLTPVKTTWSIAGLSYFGVPIDPTKRNLIQFYDTMPASNGYINSQFFTDSSYCDAIYSAVIMGGRPSYTQVNSDRNTHYMTLYGDAQLASASYNKAFGWIDLMPTLFRVGTGGTTTNNNQPMAYQGFAYVNEANYANANILRLDANSTTFQTGTVTLTTWEI